MGGMSSLLLSLNYASYLLLTLLFLAFYAVMRLTRSEAPLRNISHRDTKDLKASRCYEEELEGACESLGTCCHVPLEKVTLSHCLRLVEERIQYMARHLDELLIPMNEMTFVGSPFSSSSLDSTSSLLCSPSYFTLRETSSSWSESLCHRRHTMFVVGREGPTRPTHAHTLSRPPLLSRRDPPEEPASLHQTSAPGLDFSILQEHLQSQLRALILLTESLDQVLPSTPAQAPPEEDSTVTFDMSRVPLLGSTEWEELCTKRIQEEQDLTALRKPPTALLPPAAQSPTSGQPVLGERDIEQLWDLLPHEPTRGFPAQLPVPLRVHSGPRHTQWSQEAYVCPSEYRLPKAPMVIPAPDANPAVHVPTVAAKLQGHVAQKCLEIQTKAFPRLMSESHRNRPFLKETSPARPPQSCGELGKDSRTAFPARGQDPSQPVSHPVSRWELPCLDPEPPAKLPPPNPARGADADLSDKEINFLMEEAQETLGWHVQRKKLQQELGWPDSQLKALGAGEAPVLKPCSLKYSGEVKGDESPDHRQVWQMEKQSSGSEHSPMPGQDAAMERDRSDGAAGSQASPQPCDLLVGADLTLTCPGPERTEQTHSATQHIDQREDGTNGSEEKVELHFERKVAFGEGLRLKECTGKDGAAPPSSQDLQDAPEGPGSGQLTSSIIDTLVAGQIAQDQELKRLMGMLSSASPWADHISTGHSVYPHPGVTKSQKSQETQVSGELLGLRDTAAPNGLSGNGPSEVSRDQPPGQVCQKCSKRREKRRAGLAGADSPGRSHGIPQRETLGDSCTSAYHSMPVVWLLPGGNSKRHDGKGEKAPSKKSTMVSVATSTTGLLQAGQKAAGSPAGSPPQPSRPRTQSPSRNKVPVLKRIFMCLKQTLSKLQSKVTSRMSHDARPKAPDTKFTKPPFWRRRTSKDVRFPYY